MTVARVALLWSSAPKPPIRSVATADRNDAEKSRIALKSLSWKAVKLNRALEQAAETTLGFPYRR